MTGELEQMPTHCMPSVVTIDAGPALCSSSAAAGDNSRYSAGEAGGQRTGLPSSCWVGFNVEGAATHIQLESKEGGEQSGGGHGGGHASSGRSRAKGVDVPAGDGGKGRVGAGKTMAKKGYDPAAWDPQSGATAGALPSLIRR